MPGCNDRPLHEDDAARKEKKRTSDFCTLEDGSIIQIELIKIQLELLRIFSNCTAFRENQVSRKQIMSNDTLLA